MYPKLFELETSNLVRGFVWGMQSRRTNNFTRKWAWPRSSTPYNFLHMIEYIFNTTGTTAWTQQGYTIIDRGSTESGCQFTPPTFSSVVSNQCCLTPTFFMQKSMFGSLFVEALNDNVVVYLR